jgi:hypothetical protein
MAGEGVMHTNSVFSYSRMMASEEFNDLLRKAQTGALFRKLFSRREGLQNFRDLQPALNPAGHYHGVQEIPVERIVGSVGRGLDFDRDFRPLVKHLRYRWIRVYLLNQELDWPPIRVYQVGSHYFVEDGHNRVSVARRLGMPTIRAEVWVYRIKTPADPVRRCSRQFNDLPLAE